MKKRINLGQTLCKTTELIACSESKMRRKRYLRKNYSVKLILVGSCQGIFSCLHRPFNN